MRGLMWRGAGTLADQALSSVTNFAVAIVAARGLGTVGFGAFAIAFSAYVFCLVVCRAITSTPLVIRFSGSVLEQEWKQAVSQATGSAISIGLVGGLVLLGAGSVYGGAVGWGVAMVGICLPGLLLQDVWRFSFFAQGRPWRSAMNDAAWLLLLIPGLMLPSLLGAESSWAYVLGWGLAAGGAGCIGIIQSRVWPHARGVGRWLRLHRDLMPSLVGEVIVINGSRQIVILAIGAVAGLAESGALRGGQVLFGPLHVLFLGLAAFSVPEGVRWLQNSRALATRGLALLSVGLATVALAWGFGAMMVPSEVGVGLLGATWESASRVIVPLAIAGVASGLSVGAMSGLRILEQVRLSFAIRSVVGVAVLVLGVTGGVLEGAQGAASGIAIALTLGAAAWWVAFLRSGDNRRNQGGLEVEQITGDRDLSPE